MKKLLVFVLAIVTIMSLMSCKKKEQQPVPKAPQMTPGIQKVPDAQMTPGTQMTPSAQMPPNTQMPPGHGTGVGTLKSESKVVVPDNVKGKWAAVKIVVEDKTTKKSQEFTVKLNGEFKIPNSDIKISVGEFLPDFRIESGAITSVSDQPNNPAVGIKVFEGGKQIYPEPGRQWGWLYTRFPTVHPFEHPRYGLALKEGVRKG